MPPLLPNILFLMADQLRYDYVTPTFTPNLLSLANRGLRLNSAYTSTPSCTPARSALLTGLSPWYHGMLGYSNLPPSWPFEMPREVTSLGYSTASVGKNHYWNPSYMANTSVPPPSHGWEEEYLYDGLGDGLGAEEFDTYDQWFKVVSSGQDPLKSGGLDWNSWRGAPYEYNEEWHPTSWVARTARAWLTNHSATSSNPFFLKVSFHRPHSPYDPPPRVLNATLPSSLPPVSVGAPWDARFKGPSQWCGPSDADAWCGAMPEEAFETSRRAYLASVKFMDEQLGTVLDTLDTLGLSNSTWVIFTSDHGDGQGEHNLWRKTFPYELSAHVPGIIAWPLGAAVAATPGSTTPLLAEMRDIFPTVLDLASGGTAPGLAALNGSSWACLAAKDPSGQACGAGGGAWRTTLDLEHNQIFNATNHWSALVTQAGFKYIFSAYDGSEQLFDIGPGRDTHEMVDLAQDPGHAPLLKELREAMGQQFVREGRGEQWVGADGLPKVRPSIPFSPHFPTPPSPSPSPPCPPQPPITKDCSQWFSTVGKGGYYRSCGGPSGNLAPFSKLSLKQAQDWCCNNTSCAGFDFTRGGATGSGFFKTNALGGWLDSSVYEGVYKVGQVPGH